ncbi:CitMHS family transporter [Anaerosphaera multitolerans]|uniref:Citrate transporter n=1 Tax=Anaerosphaera multitolerans TaxID=2487351 RepID=A0A437S860_9FIRM|nr:citrate:proton symporter [Anaerosphaera multitolerans]RVU55270.1 citrate transporter [Anaerosphaera multitolerans]
MTLTILAWGMIIVFLALVMTKKMQPFTALVLVPLVFTIIGAFLGLYTEQVSVANEISASQVGLWDQIKIVGDWTVDGIQQTSKTGIMLLFAILFFAIMLNAGLFDPVTKSMIKMAKGDPVKVLVGTAVVAAAVSLNGDGTTTTLICCTAFIPIYKKLNLKMMNLGVLIILMNTIMNLLPWGGPTARVISVLAEQPGVNEQTILKALIPGMVVSVVYMLGVAYYLGLKERKRVGIQNLTDADIEALTAPASEEEEALKRPQNLVINAILTIGIVIMLVVGTFPSLFLFLVGTALALMINYKKISEQKARIQDNAGDALQVVILVLGAGIFMGLFTNSGMSDALAASLIKIIPESLGRFWGLITAIVSAPGTFFLSNDAFYYGVLPVFAEAGYQYGFTALEIGTASLLGQAFHLLSPLVAFIYLLLNLTGLDMGAWQKESAKWAIGIFVIFIGMAAITGAVPLFK